MAPRRGEALPSDGGSRISTGVSLELRDRHEEARVAQRVLRVRDAAYGELFFGYLVVTGHKPRR